MRYERYQRAGCPWKSTACGNSCQSLVALSLVNRRQFNKQQKNSCIPPGVGRHHHLREECEKREGEHTVSGVQHAATGPAEWPTHAAQSQLHTAADLRGEEKQKQMHVSPSRGWQFPAASAHKHTRGTHSAVPHAAGECSESSSTPLQRPHTGAGAVALRVATGARTFGSGSAWEAPSCM